MRCRCAVRNGAWQSGEYAVIDRFFDASMSASVQRLEFVRWPVGWRLEFDLADVLTLVVTAHGDLERVLPVWGAADDPEAAVHMAALCEDVIRQTMRTFFHSVHLGEYAAAAADTIGAFLLRHETTPRIEASFFMVTDPRLQQLLSDATSLD